MAERAENKARIVVVDDHAIVRDGIVELLNRHHDLCVCGTAGDAASALQVVEKNKPDLVLLDLMLAGGDGLELLKQLKALHPKIPALVLSMHDEAIYAERVLRAGAQGYLMKQVGTLEMLEAIHTVLAGEIHVSRKIAVTVLQKLLASGDAVSTLTDRELHVFQLIGAGLPNREIASRMGLSVKTIEAHRENLKRKLNAKNAAELVRQAAEWVCNGSIPG